MSKIINNTKKKYKTLRKYKSNLEHKQISKLKKIPKTMQLLFAKIWLGKAGTLEAIKGKCLSCSCYERKEITKCHVNNCPLWIFRPYQRSMGETSHE